jgi:hypothetical protein
VGIIIVTRSLLDSILDSNSILILVVYAQIIYDVQIRLHPHSPNSDLDVEGHISMENSKRFLEPSTIDDDIDLRRRTVKLETNNEA